MKTLTLAELSETLRLHKLWLEGKDEGVQANLSGVNLSGANLSWVNLFGATLYGADLSGADLSGATLTWATLTWAKLTGANLSGANLRGVNLSGANLSEANLSGANLSGVNLSGANLRGAKNFPPREIAKRQIVPPVGEFIGYKKVYNRTRGAVVIGLRIPAGAKRVGGVIGRKCRASCVVALGSGVSNFDGSFKYTKGKKAKPKKPFNPDPLVECTSGIHFFLTPEEAVDY